MNNDTSEGLERAFGDSVFLLRAAFGALRVRLLLSWTVGLGLVTYLCRVVGDPALAWLPALLAWIAGLFGAACVSVSAARHVRVNEKLPLKRSLGVAGRATVCAFTAQVAWAAAAGTLFLLALSGQYLNFIPQLGDLLFSVWNYSLGLVAVFVVSAMVVAAVGFYPLVVPFAVVERPDPIAALTASLDYVRRRPLKYFFGCFTVLVGTLLALVPFALVSVLAAALVLGSRLLQAGEVTPTHGIVPAVLAVLERLSPADGSVPETQVLGLWIAAFAAVSLQLGCTRIFLILRRDVDGVPMSKTAPDDVA